MNPRQPINESVQQVINDLGFSQRSSLLLEAVLADVLRHIAGKDDAEEGSTVPVTKNPHFAILTSWRKFEWKDDEQSRIGDEKLLGQEIKRRFSSDAAKSKAVNQKNYEDLIEHFKALGLPITRLTGSWLETGNQTNTDPFERSLFVAGDLSGKEDGRGKLNLEDVQKLGRDYNQDSVIYAGPETEGTVHLYGQDRKTGEWSRWAVWKNVKVDAARTIAQNLQSQKRKLLGSAIKRWLGFKPKPEDASNAGASQVGGEGRGKIRLLGTSRTDPTASDKAFRFAESLIERLLFPCEYPSKHFKAVYESEGFKPADLGVELLSQAAPGPYQQARSIRETLAASRLDRLANRSIHLDRIHEAVDEIARKILKQIEDTP